MTKTFTLLLCLPFAACTLAQTEPKKPQTVDVQLPPPLTLPSDVPAAKLSADEAVAVALEKSPILIAAKANVLAASGKQQQVQAGLVPNVTLSSAFNHVETVGGSGGSGNTGTGSNPSGYNSSLTVRQLVFDFEKTINAARQAKLLEKVASGVLSQTQLDVAFAVKQAYFGLSESQQVVSVAEANVQSVGLQLELAKALMNSGLGAPPDVVRATTSYDNALQSLVLARTSELGARVALANVIGIDPRTPIAADDTPEADLSHDSLEALVQAALQDRPDMLAANFGVMAADAGLSASKSASAPSLSVSLGLTSRGDTNPFDTRTGLAGINVAWPVGDGGLTRGLVNQAKAGQQSAQATLQQIKLNIVSDVSNAFVQIQAAEQRVKVSEAEKANAQESVRIAEGRYKAGIGTFLEVTDAQSALVLAETNDVLARSALNRGRAALRRAVGKRP